MAQGYYVLVYILDILLFKKPCLGIPRSAWNSSEIPWKLKPFNPCLDMQLPWNMYPHPCLEIQGFSRPTSFSPWSFQLPSTLKTLEIFRTGHLDLERTLNLKVNFEEPWNSRLGLSTLVHFKCSKYVACSYVAWKWDTSHLCTSNIIKVTAKNTFQFSRFCKKWRKYWHQILSVLIKNTSNSTFFTCTLGHVKKNGIVDVLNSRHLKFDASTTHWHWRS